MSEQSRVIAKLPDYLLAAICFFFFLIPMSLTGLLEHAPRLWPACLHDYYRISCLFTQRTRSWGVYYAQAQFQGSNQWQTLDLHDYFQLKPFGYRTRLHPLMSYSFGRGALGLKQRQELAEYLRNSLSRDKPELPTIESIRFVFLSFSSGGWLAEAPSKWEMKTLDELLPFADGAAVASTHRFDGKSPLEGGRL